MFDAALQGMALVMQPTVILVMLIARMGEAARAISIAAVCSGVRGLIG